MAALTPLKIAFYVGDTHTVRFLVQNPDATPFDLTGASGVMTIHNNTGTVLATTTGSVAVGVDGVVVFRWDPADTEDIAPGQYHYHAKVIMGDSSVYTIAVSTVNLWAV